MDDTMEQHLEHELFTKICTLMPTLRGAELKVLLQVARHTRASEEAEVAIALRELTWATGLSPSGARAALHSLSGKHLLAAHPQRTARGGYRPTHYAVPFLPRVTPPAGAPASGALGQEEPRLQRLWRGRLLACLKWVLAKKGRAQGTTDGQDRPWLRIPVPAHFYIAQKTWAFCLRNLWRRKPTLIVGPTGCGKTELITHLAQATGRHLYPVNMGATTDPRAALVGTTHFRDGPPGASAGKFTVSALARLSTTQMAQQPARA